MPATKIINVSKDDSLEELLDIVRATPAQEVIFVLPRKSKVLASGEHLAILANQAQKKAKHVAFLCADPNVNALAREYGFEVLAAKETQPIATLTRQDAMPPTSARGGPVLPSDEEDTETNWWEEPPKQSTRPSDDDDDIPDSDEHGDIPEETEDEESEKKPPPPPRVAQAETAKIAQFQDSEPVAETTGQQFEVLTAAQHLKVKPSGVRRAEPIDITRATEAELDRDIESVWRREAQLEHGRQSLGKDSIWSDVLPKKHARRGLWAGNRDTERSFREPRQRGAGSFGKRAILIIGGIVVVLLGLYIGIRGKALVTIIPKDASINFELKAAASDTYANVDSSFNHIPGQRLEIRKDATQTFTPSGERDVVQKARGTLTVYNAYGTAPQPLIATTRFSDSAGHIFRSLTTATVPGINVVNGQIVPGSVDIEVIADKPGSEYNIGPSDFHIPAFQERGDTDRYQKFYAKSTAPIKGGIVGKSKVVTQGDYNSARDMLTAQVMEQLKEAFDSQAAGLTVINQSATVIADPKSSAAADEAADSFTMTVSGSLTTIAFRIDDVHALIAQYVERTSGLVAMPEHFTTSFKDPTLQTAANDTALSFTIAVDGVAFQKVDTKKIADDLAGKDKTQMTAYLQGAPGVQSARVSLKPFWTMKIPKNTERITISISYEKPTN